MDAALTRWMQTARERASTSGAEPADRDHTRRVLALGEPNHGSREVFALKSRLIVEAARAGGLTHVAMEASTDRCLPLGEYVAGRRAWDDSLLLDIGFWTWRTEEVRDLLHALRAHNDSGASPVAFVGVDPQLPTASAEMVRAALQRAGTLDAASTRLLDILSLMRVGDALPSGAAHLLRDITAHLDTEEEVCAFAALGDAARLASGEAGFAAVAARDALMAERVLRLVQAPGARVAVWAHNAHVAKRPYGGGRVRSMGQHLAEALGPRYWALGVFAGSGSFRAYTRRPFGRVSAAPEVVRWPGPGRGTLESVLEEAGGGGTYVLDLAAAATAVGPAPADLSRAWPVRTAGSLVSTLTWRWQHDTCCPGEDLDALAFVPTVTPTTPLPEGDWRPPFRR
ncbi:erythromycin esterase family protein [Kineococcus sp. SYSU DK002]|uniref:erythromycin esterase family protein n=1 Tax=Kineococcus sp. SYSU DK002 TaxID=3383123 RepID=UPI003D7DF72B